MKIFWDENSACEAHLHLLNSPTSHGARYLLHVNELATRGPVSSSDRSLVFSFSQIGLLHRSVCFSSVSLLHSVLLDTCPFSAPLPINFLVESLGQFNPTISNSHTYLWDKSRKWIGIQALRRTIARKTRITTCRSSRESPNPLWIPTSRCWPPLDMRHPHWARLPPLQIQRWTLFHGHLCKEIS